MITSEMVERQVRPDDSRPPLRLVSLRAWIWLGAFGLLVAGFVLWGLFGRLNITLYVQGTLYPNSANAAISAEQARLLQVGMVAYAHCTPTLRGTVTHVTPAMVYLVFGETPYQGVSCPVEIIIDAQAPVERLLP